MIRQLRRKDMLALLAKHSGMTEKLMTQIIETRKTLLENKGNDLSSLALRMYREVVREIHANTAFLRLSISPHGILHAKIDVKHRVEEDILLFFSERFPVFVILLESRDRVFSAKNGKILGTEEVNLEESVLRWEELLPVNPLVADLDIDDYEVLWENFARSQDIKTKHRVKKKEWKFRYWKNTRVSLDPTNRSKLTDFFTAHNPGIKRKK